MSDELPQIPDDIEMAELRREAKRLFACHKAQEIAEQEVQKRAEESTAKATKEYVDGVFKGIGKAAASQRRKEEETFKEVDEEAERQLRELEASEARWKKANEELDLRNKELDLRVKEIWKGVRQAESDVVDLKEAITETQRAIEEKNARDENSAWGQIAIIAGCALASYLTGIGIAQPQAGKGLMVGATWAL